jgi:hypothetical protein
METCTANANLIVPNGSVATAGMRRDIIVRRFKDLNLLAQKDLIRRKERFVGRAR